MVRAAGSGTRVGNPAAGDRVRSSAPARTMPECGRDVTRKAWPRPHAVLSHGLVRRVWSGGTGFSPMLGLAHPGSVGRQTELRLASSAPTFFSRAVSKPVVPPRDRRGAVPAPPLHVTGTQHPHIR